MKTKKISYEEFKNLVSECPGMQLNLTFGDYKKIISMSKYFLKVQNDCINEKCFDYPIKTVSAFDVEKNEIRTFAIFATKPLDFIQWVKLQIADMFYCNKNEIKNFVGI